MQAHERSIIRLPAPRQVRHAASLIFVPRADAGIDMPIRPTTNGAAGVLPKGRLF